MTARFTADEIIEIAGGRLASGMLPVEAGAVCTDTRTLAPGDWYLALSGERFDGHDFLGDAFAAGAIGCIVAERPAYAIAETQFPLIAVGDTLEAYHLLARNWRRRINPLVVGVTGSSGKTTTKEMCAAVFSAGMRVHKSRANENNEYGVPRTILSMPEDSQVLIVEMAMRGLGQIALLAQTAGPDIGIVVNAGAAHIGMLSSLENIIRAKCELLERLDPGSGVAVIGQATPGLMKRVGEVFGGPTVIFEEGCVDEALVTPELTVFTAKPLPDSVRLGRVAPSGRPAGEPLQEFVVHAHGLSQLQDAWCAITAGRLGGLSDEVISQGLASFRPVAGRGNRLVTAGGAIVIDETYNANPDSVRSSVLSFIDPRVFPQPRKFLVLGDLAELGEESESLHRELGAWLEGKALAGLVTVGALARHIADGARNAPYEVLPCMNQSEAEAAIRDRLAGDACVLVKGSRAAGLEKLVVALVVPAVPQGT